MGCLWEDFLTFACSGSSSTKFLLDSDFVLFAKFYGIGGSMSGRCKDQSGFGGMQPTLTLAEDRVVLMRFNIGRMALPLQSKSGFNPIVFAI